MPSLGSIATFCSLIGLVALANAVQGDSPTCQTLESSTNIHIDRPPSRDYTVENQHYWSAGCAALLPACIIKPSNTEQVSTIVRTLQKNNETFAVKSGGHNSNPNFASIDGGPLISTANLNEVAFDESSMTVRIGPGNRWEDVHKVLDGTGATVVGGRIGDVGVGGYILGVGLSFLSGQYGWAANNVVEFELVLANGTITTASNSTNSDLFKALKGGGPNFGIVTSYTLAAHPIGQVWGGNLVFGGEKSPEILRALQDFTQNYPDEKAGIILTSEITLANLAHFWTLFVFYDGPTPPSGVFDMFTSLEPTINNAKTRSYYDLIAFNDWAVLHGSVYTIATETAPLLPADSPGAINTTDAHLEDVFNHWVNVSNTFFDVPGLIASIAFQPYPAIFARKTREIEEAFGGSGDLIAFDDAADRMIIEFDFSYFMGSPERDEKMDRATQEVYEGAKTIIDAAVDDGRAPDVYRPLFLNHVYWREDYWGRIDPDSKRLAESVKQKVDPNGFWKSRSAGGAFL